jgi:hypothetical protein
VAIEVEQFLTILQDPWQADLTYAECAVGEIDAALAAPNHLLEFLQRALAKGHPGGTAPSISAGSKWLKAVGLPILGRPPVLHSRPLGWIALRHESAQGGQPESWRLVGVARVDAVRDVLGELQLDFAIPPGCGSHAEAVLRFVLGRSFQQPSARSVIARPPSDDSAARRLLRSLGFWGYTEGGNRDGERLDWLIGYHQCMGDSAAGWRPPGWKGQLDFNRAIENLADLRNWINYVDAHYGMGCPDARSWGRDDEQHAINNTWALLRIVQLRLDLDDVPPQPTPTCLAHEAAGEPCWTESQVRQELDKLWMWCDAHRRAWEGQRISDAGGRAPGDANTTSAPNATMPEVSPTPVGAATPNDDRPNVSDDSHLCPAKLAELFRVPADALRTRLSRWRKRNLAGWIENSEHGPRESKYLYRVGAVRCIIDAMTATSKTTSKRPAKKK